MSFLYLEAACPYMKNLAIVSVHMQVEVTNISVFQSR